MESLPLKKTEIFGGKLLASVAILLFMMLVMACFSIVMSLFGGANAGYACLALAVAFLLDCAILSGIVFFSVLFRKRLYAWIASYAFVGIFFIGSRIVAGSNGAVGKVFGYLFLFESFSPLSYNLFVWNILPYYLGVALAFFGVSLWILSELQTKKAILSLGLSLLLLVSTVASAFLPAYARSVDMSEEETMSVSVTTEKYLTTLDSDVTLYLLIDDLSEAPYVDYRFEAFLDRYVSHSDRLTLERIPLSKSGSLLAEFGVSELSASYAYCVVAKSELRSRIVSYTDMLYYIHNDQTLSSIGLPTQFSYTEYDSYLETLYQYAVSDSTYTEAYYAFLSSPKIHFVGETLLNELIEYVCAEIIPTSYVLTGHGESDPNGLLLGSLVAGYRALNLSSVEEVPADAAAILLLSPDTDYTAEELMNKTKEKV